MAKTKKGLASEVLADIIAHSMQEKKAVEIIQMDLRNVGNAFCDFFVICTANSDKQLDAIAEEISKEVYLGIKEHPLTKEGLPQNGWVLLDYFNVVVHIFLADKRDKFGLEELWGDAKTKKIEEGN